MLVFLPVYQDCLYAAAWLRLEHQRLVRVHVVFDPAAYLVDVLFLPLEELLLLVMLDCT